MLRPLRVRRVVIDIVGAISSFLAAALASLGGRLVDMMQVCPGMMFPGILSGMEDDGSSRGTQTFDDSEMDER